MRLSNAQARVVTSLTCHVCVTQLRVVEAFRSTLEEMEERRSHSSTCQLSSLPPAAGARVLLRHSRSHHGDGAVSRLAFEEISKRNSLPPSVAMTTPSPPSTLITSSLNGHAGRTKTELARDWPDAAPSDVITVRVNSLQEVDAREEALLVDFGCANTDRPAQAPPLSPLTHLSVSDDVTGLEFFNIHLDEESVF